MKYVVRSLIILMISITACTTRQPIQGTSIDEMNSQMHQAIKSNQALDYQSARRRVPGSVAVAMVPDISVNIPAAKRDDYARRFDLTVRDIPSKIFFMGLVKGTRYSMVVSPEVTGTITLNLKHVTIEEVLKTVEDVYGYQYRRTPYGYEILPNKLETRMYSVNYLDVDRRGNSHTELTPGEVTQEAVAGTNGSSSGGTSSSTSTIPSTPTTASPGSVNSSSPNSVTTQTNLDFWKQLRETLNSIIDKTDGLHAVMVNPQAGLVVVRAYPKELKQIGRYLSSVENNMDRQVILEAKVLEVTLNNNYQMGIDWKIFGAQLNAINTFPNTTIDNAQFPNAFNINIQWNPTDFTTDIQALETQGNVQVLSSPRVATMNNQKALIKVGTDQFFVTNVSTSTAQTVNSTIPTQNIQLTPFFSGISLDVTPQIDQYGNVTLHIHPTVSEVTTHETTIDLGTINGTFVLPLALSTIRESDTIVHAKNGQVVVIGGLMQNQNHEDIAQLPWFGNIPFLGTLFRNTKQDGTKSELVILLRPTVVKRHVWTKELKDSQQEVMALKRGFHIGGREDLYGSDGEQPLQLGPPSGQLSENHSHAP